MTVSYDLTLHDELIWVKTMSSDVNACVVLMPRTLPCNIVLRLSYIRKRPNLASSCKAWLDDSPPPPSRLPNSWVRMNLDSNTPRRLLGLPCAMRCVEGSASYSGKDGVDTAPNSQNTAALPRYWGGTVFYALMDVLARTFVCTFWQHVCYIRTRRINRHAVRSDNVRLTAQHTPKER